MIRRALDAAPRVKLVELGTLAAKAEAPGQRVAIGSLERSSAQGLRASFLTRAFRGVCSDDLCNPASTCRHLQSLASAP